jgi:hypothetical protein
MCVSSCGSVERFRPEYLEFYSMWKIDGENVQLTLNQWEANYRITQPGKGMILRSLSPRQQQATICMISPGVGGAARPTESYIRNNDLIVDYAQQNTEQFSYETYFRSLPSIGQWTFGLEIWLSVQTNLLDSTPNIDFSCDTSEQAWAIQHDWNQPSSQTPWFLTSATASSQSPHLAVMVHPLDVEQTKIIRSDTNPSWIALKLFSEFMEKGVIRRGRLRIYASSAATPDSDDLRKAYDDFVKSELPLTT